MSTENADAGPTVTFINPSNIYWDPTLIAVLLLFGLEEDLFYFPMGDVLSLYAE